MVFDALLQMEGVDQTVVGSSRISVKSAKYSEYPELEVAEIPVSECDAYCCPYSMVSIRLSKNIC